MKAYEPIRYSADGAVAQLKRTRRSSRPRHKMRRSPDKEHFMDIAREQGLRAPTLYGKGERQDLSAADLRRVLKLLAEITNG